MRHLWFATISLGLVIFAALAHAQKTKQSEWPQRGTILEKIDASSVERIRDEPMQLEIHIASSTIRKYVRLALSHPAHGQNWSTFLRTTTSGCGLPFSHSHRPLLSQI